MSIKLMAAAWDLDIGSTEKMVLMCLCDYANDEGGNCFPSVPTLARKCSKSERTIQGAIKWLKDNGFLTLRDSAGHSHNFILNPRSICAPAETAPPQKTAKTPAKSAPYPRRSCALSTKEPSNNHQGQGASRDALTPQAVVDGWNELAEACDLPRVAKLTDSRRTRLKARIRQYPEMEAWQRAFASIHRSAWLRGSNERGWKADFDFLLQDKSFTKLVEGSYGN